MTIQVRSLILDEVKRVWGVWNRIVLKTAYRHEKQRG